MKGKIVDSVPPVSRSVPANDWDSPAMLARMSGRPVLAGEHVKNSRVKSLRQYTRAPFVTEEGRIVIEMRNSHVEDDGERYGDVYMRWEPNTTTTTPKESN